MASTVTARVHIVSDVHGAVDAVSRAAEGSDFFVCLGDLILFLDYDAPENGIYAELFGTEYAKTYIELRTANRFEEAREFSAAAWEGIGVTSPEQRWEKLEAKVHEQYARMFAALPSPSFLTYGNVDVPQLWEQYLRPGHTVLDGGVAEVNGQRWGFLGGGLTSPMRTPYELEPDVYAQKLWDMGPVDVLFTHIPARHELLNYDTVARRFEVGSSAITDYIRKYQPRYHFFGHVHQPLKARLRMGATECINVGHFHGKEKPYIIDL
jgi:Icc-related predicted phosphoesterase